MAKGEFLGEFEQLVMLAVLRLKEEAYGMEVRREIEARARRGASIGAVYATLDRLETKVLVRSRELDPESDKGRLRHPVWFTAVSLVTVALSLAGGAWARRKLDRPSPGSLV